MFAGKFLVCFLENSISNNFAKPKTFAFSPLKRKLLGENFSAKLEKCWNLFLLTMDYNRKVSFWPHLHQPNKLSAFPPPYPTAHFHLDLIVMFPIMFQMENAKKAISHCINRRYYSIN